MSTSEPKMVTLEVMYDVPVDASADTPATTPARITKDFALPLAVACGSDVIRDAFEETGGEFEGKIPILGINPDTVMPYIISYLERSVEEPVKFIACPLRSSILTDSGVPAWAEEWAWDVDHELRTAVIEAGLALRIPMIVKLIEAHIAVCARILGSSVNDELEDPIDEATGEPKVWTSADSKDLRDQNPWLFTDVYEPALNPRFPEAASLAEACANGPVQSQVEAADRAMAKVGAGAGAGSGSSSSSGAGSSAAAAADADAAADAAADVVMKPVSSECETSHMNTHTLADADADACAAAVYEDDDEDEDLSYSIADAADDYRRRVIMGQQV